jgi:hypothetical protein
MMQAVCATIKDYRAIARFYEANELLLGPLIFSFHHDFWKWLLSSKIMTIGVVCHAKKIIAMGIGMKGWDHLIRYLPHKKFDESQIIFHETVKKMLYDVMCIEQKNIGSKNMVMKCLLPINNRRLVKLGLLDSKEPYIVPPLENKLLLMQLSDVPSVLNLLSSHSGQYDNPPVFSQEMIIDTFLPRKHIVYSFVIHNLLGESTDFITVYQGYTTDQLTGETLKVAHLGLHQASSVTPNILLRMLIGKLFNYGFDQMFIPNFVSNRDFDIEFFISSFMITYDLPNANCISWPF